MPMNMTEMLNKISSLKQTALKEETELKEGKRTEGPSVASKTFDLMERMVLNMNGNYDHGRANIREALMSTDTVKLIPKVIEGQLREAAEPEYLATKFMSTIHVDGGNTAVYVIPIVGELHAHEVGEGTRYNEEYVDWNTAENGQLEVRVKKVGLKVSITEEALADSSWDIYGINVRKMGQAMGRFKEEWIFNNFSHHGHVIFDNARREQNPEAGTNGRAADGSLNDTMTVEDFLDLALALQAQDQTPTDIIIHPLAWVVFARNAMIGNGLTYGAFGGSQVHPWGATQGTPGFAGLSAEEGPQKMIMRPEQVQGRLPMDGITVSFSPFVKFDKIQKKFDMYILNRNNVGVIVQREGLTTDNWQDPERDLRLLKVKERYGIGILDNGRGIAVAKNIAVAPTYPVPQTVKVQTDIPVVNETKAGK